MNLRKRCALSVTQQKMHRHRFLTSAPQCKPLAQNRIRPVMAKKRPRTARNRTKHKIGEEEDKVVPPPRLELGTC